MNAKKQCQGPLPILHKKEAAARYLFRATASWSIPIIWNEEPQSGMASRPFGANKICRNCASPTAMSATRQALRLERLFPLVVCICLTKRFTTNIFILQKLGACLLRLLMQRGGVIQCQGRRKKTTKDPQIPPYIRSNRGGETMSTNFLWPINCECRSNRAESTARADCTRSSR